MRRRSSEILRQITAQLVEKYEHEAGSLALLLMEDILELSKNDTLLDNPVEVSGAAARRLDECLKMLLADIPIQHILGWADFYGHRFKVSNQVLIPRQETEELVQAVSYYIKAQHYTSLLDLGTGSGCIAISLALENSALRVTAVDISPPALEIARENARILGAQIMLKHADMLKENLPERFDVIVSNPPYVMESEKETLPANVLYHEPPTALFVPDDQPLLFYERIAGLARRQLNGNGLLFLEINEKFGRETETILQQHGFINIERQNDLNNKPRFVFGFKK